MPFIIKEVVWEDFRCRNLPIGCCAVLAGHFGDVGSMGQAFPRVLGAVVAVAKSAGMIAVVSKTGSSSVSSRGGRQGPRGALSDFEEPVQDISPRPAPALCLFHRVCNA